MAKTRARRPGPHRIRRAVQILSLVALNPALFKDKSSCLPVLNCWGCPAASLACPVGVVGELLARGVVPFLTLGIALVVGVAVDERIWGPSGKPEPAASRNPDDDMARAKARLAGPLTGARLESTVSFLARAADAESVAPRLTELGPGRVRAILSLFPAWTANPEILVQDAWRNRPELKADLIRRPVGSKRDFKGTARLGHPYGISHRGGARREKAVEHERLRARKGVSHGPRRRDRNPELLTYPSGSVIHLKPCLPLLCALLPLCALCV